ncbi:MAG: DUF308 domain-containing protein [Gemmatimonadota bacterium]|nr:DUF308 domain-containing protein [Gemmatimonadota bacterium]
MRILEAVQKDAKNAKRLGWFLIVAGVLAVLAPFAAGLSVAILVGVLLVFAGVAQLALAARTGMFGDGLPVLLFGVLALIAGVYMIARPGLALATLTLLLAVYFVVSGVVEVIGAFSARPASGWGLVLCGGVISFVLGIMIWRQFPVSGVWAVGILVGLHMLFRGTTLVTIGGAVSRATDAALQARDG